MKHAPEGGMRGGPLGQKESLLEALPFQMRGRAWCLVLRAIGLLQPKRGREPEDGGEGSALCPWREVGWGGYWWPCFLSSL